MLVQPTNADKHTQVFDKHIEKITFFFIFTEQMPANKENSVTKNTAERKDVYQSVE